MTTSTSGTAGGGGQFNHPGSSVAWTSDTNQLADDTSSARAQLLDTPPGNTSSNWLYNNNLGLSIPAGATIRGITAFIWGRSFRSNTVGLSARLHIFTTAPDNANILAPDSANAEIVRAGGLVAGDGFPADSDAAKLSTFSGGSTDLWGRSWTAEQVNDAAFGVCYRASCTTVNTSPDNQLIRWLFVDVDWTAAISAPSVDAIASGATGEQSGLQEPREVP